MHIHNFLLPKLYSISTIIFILLTASASYGDEDEQFYICSTPFSCGEYFQDTYPFWGGNRSPECGLPEFELKCHQGDYFTIDIANQTFRVLSIAESDPAMTIARNDLWDDICPDKYRDTDLNGTIFHNGQDVESLTLFYGCPQYVNTSVRNNFTCTINGISRIGYFADESFTQVDIPLEGSCELSITVPVPKRILEDFRLNKSVILKEMLNQGFPVEYTIDNTACSACQRSNGLCWYGTNSETHTCLCRDGAHPYICPGNKGGGLNVGRKIGIGFGAAAVSAVVVCLIFVLYQRRHKKEYSASTLISQDISSYPSSVTDIEKSGCYFGVHVFTYNDLQEATNNFDSNKVLGDGGFGTVYKGKLRDGRVVAVKRLYENNFRRVEQFMNEVEMLTRLRHKNLVSLYGCTSRHCRELLLVYEYIPNGTVADHLHGALARPGSLSWNTRMSIAVETASALAYLHASDVIHRDVKTNNILLDSNFCVKVADFGLSRLFPTNVTHISTAPQGTPGYVDPEYHQCYHLTDKSDVYSFGVVLIELISSKPPVDITRHRHEINLSNMAINKIQSHALHELVDPDLGYASDNRVMDMITAVAELAFQCLQYGTDMRPSMQEVLKSLQQIQSQDYSLEKAEAKDIPPDDDVLLKTKQHTGSPDSVTTEWLSSSATRSTSG